MDFDGFLHVFPSRQVRFASSVARRLRILGARSLEGAGQAVEAVMRGDRNSAHGLLDSLEHFDIQNRPATSDFRGFSRRFEAISEGVRPFSEPQRC